MLKASGLIKDKRYDINGFSVLIDFFLCEIIKQPPWASYQIQLNILAAQPVSFQQSYIVWKIM